MGSDFGPRFAHQYRLAQPADASEISALYNEEYCTADGGDARDNYPFPQFLEPNWVSTAVEREEIRWIVAELDGRVVGSAGAMRNIGSPADRVAEVFGIVVKRDVRSRHIGQGLLEYLYRLLEADSNIVLCEARTGDARGWKVARHAGFEPVGFEPFAHATPVGSESMLMTMRIRDHRNCGPVVSGGTEAVRDLARTVCQISESTIFQDSTMGAPSRTTTGAPSPNWSTSSFDGHLGEVVRDDDLGAAFLSQWQDRPAHCSGVVNFVRLEGIDRYERGRYDGRHYVLRARERVIAGARAIWDRRDGRVRILDFQAVDESARDSLLHGMVRALAATTEHIPLIVIDIRADAQVLQSRLETLGFVPTAYYPALISVGPSRIDGIQYTLLNQRPISESLVCLDQLDWDAARRVVEQVVRLAQNQPFVLRKRQATQT